MTQSDQILDLLKITRRLGDVLERESAIVRAHKPEELDAVRRDKLTLSASYEGHVRALRDDPALLASAAPELRAQLKTAFGRFENTLAENERSLRAAKESSERILRAIADEVDRQRSDKLAYSAKGDVAAAAQSASRPPVSVAIDERF